MPPTERTHGLAVGYCGMYPHVVPSLVPLSPEATTMVRPVKVTFCAVVSNSVRNEGKIWDSNAP